MRPQTIVITGANRGIGLAIARVYRKRGDRVIALCRRASDALRGSGAEIVEGVDVTSSEALQRTALEVESVDVLIANAGVLSNEPLASVDDDRDRIERQFAVNALGPLLTVHAFTDKLARGAKVALITSRMGSIADNSSGGSYGYRMSKAALNAAGRSLAIDLAPRGIAVGLLHPGYVRTDMTGGRGNVEASEAAAMLVERIDELDASNSGSFRHANGEALPW
ncbi:MAG TPA: SDR family oxidoreductase [Woeseiaceae bacterium]|nr:SDR family oxidoreductase [Woeseiaceae bacterium]